MDSSPELYIDLYDDNNYRVTGATSQLLQNSRALISLRRLRYSEVDETIMIPFIEVDKIKTLESFTELAKKFGFDVISGDAIKQNLSTYAEEVRNFDTFSDKAFKIRNNEFSQSPELVDDFEAFKRSTETHLSRKLYDLQLLSAFHMAFSQNACNFAVPGAGKTSIVYAAYSFLKNLPEEDPRHVDKILVIGPLSSFAPWEKEYRKCFGRAVESQRLSGNAKISKAEKEMHLYSDNPKELTLMSHAGMYFLKNQVMDFLRQNKVLVVVDEAHRIKNVDGIWGKLAIEIAKEAKSRVILTGTPAPNGFEDIYNLIQFIYPYHFKKILGIHYGQLRELTKAEEDTDNPRVAEFIRNVQPYFIRIKKSDLNLPPIDEKKIWVHMDKSQRKIYDFIEEKYVPLFAAKSSATVKDVLNKARLIRLRQAATNPSLLIKPLRGSLENSDDGYDPNARFTEEYNESIDDSEIFKEVHDYLIGHVPPKFMKINEILQDEILPGKQKVVIWTIFVQNAVSLQEYLAEQGIASKLLIGHVPQDEREDTIDRFNDPENEDFSVVIANPFSVSESISLHEGCHNAIYMERDYNAANFIQSKDRIHRVGLKPGTVTNYYYLISPDSVDEVMNDSLNKKVTRMESIIDEEIPLFRVLDDEDETSLIKQLLRDYARRTQES